MGDKIKQAGVFGGSIEDGDDTLVVGFISSELVDDESGVVTETVRNIERPSRGAKIEIRDARYRRLRTYVLQRRAEIARAEAYRKRAVNPNWKPERRHLHLVRTSMTCPDCNGSGWLHGEDCQACDGEGWKVGD